MNKIIAIGLAALLAACGGAQGPLKPGRAPDAGNAVIVARVELSPAINDDLEEAGENDEPMTFGLITTPGNGENIKPFDEDVDTEYDSLKTNEFFAIEVKGGEKLAIRDLKFFAYHKAYWLSNTEHFYYTTLSNPSYALDVTPETGKAYYIGTIKIQLADRSFAEDDGEYNREEFNFVVPKNIAIADESAAAQKWFAEHHEKVGSKLNNTTVTMKDSDRENSFIHNAVTTTYR